MQRKATRVSRTQGREPQFNLFEMPRARAPHGPALYFKMKAVVQAHPDVLRAYKADFYVHDRRKIRTMLAGQRWVWVIRRHGTNMLPVGLGQAPIWITSWLESDDTALTFLITVTADGADGTIEPISHEVARQLAQEPPPKGFVAWRPTMFGVTLVRDGKEIAKASMVNDRVFVAAGTEHIGSYVDWAAASVELERRYGPRPATVGA